jgi:peroxiredoxin Q/BCP
MQCKALRDSAKEIQNFDVAYFMASVDPLEKNIAFAQEHNAGFPILSDPEKKLVEACGAKHQMGFANRWTYFVDKDGIVVKIDKEVNPQTAGADLARIMGELGFPKK